eukprot:TRINITY_DN1190_c0_g1_i1.p1 TRINITY_DN1190_c0_g1~~TRINITY_DN1190_c0_g1_i1.p1  ORF type:complete len:297 (-),score=89.49 TRINITY_DN1190_c0_g1_i1:144-1034(-)
MADRLSKIYGTEEDKVNCPFFFKIGACRHGDRCSRAHHKPLFSQTICLPHMYQNPMSNYIGIQGAAPNMDQEKLQADFEDFYEEIFDELAKHGEVEELIVLDNLGDHMVGNVYCKFYAEEDAQQAQQALHTRFYAGRPLIVEYCPVTDFREARCRQFDEANCGRGGYCNFMHMKPVSRSLKKDLFRHQPHHGEHSGEGGGRDRSRSRDRPHRSSRHRSGSGDRRRSSRHRSHRSHRHRSRSGERRSHRSRRSRSRSHRRERDVEPAPQSVEAVLGQVGAPIPPTMPAEAMPPMPPQ